MPRPRSCADADILKAVGTILAERGESRLTLAAVGKCVRLSPATLLQRFGSKQKLLRAFAENAAENATTILQAARQEHPSMLWALQQGLRNMHLAEESPAPGMAALRLAPADPAVADAVARYTRAVRDELDAMLHQGVLSGELLPCDTRSLSDAVYALWTGATLNAPLLSGDTDPLQAAERTLGVLILPYRRPTFAPPR